MRGKPSIEAADANALREILLQWGRTAPDRLNRTGRKAEVERWILARWLEFQLDSNELLFPLKVWRDENPDFYVQTGNYQMGLEIVEAVDPDEQVVWTATAKQDEADDVDHVHDIDEKWLSASLYTQMVAKEVDKKAKHCSADCSELLVYLNTTDDIADDLSTRERKLGKALRNQARFRCVWVLSGQCLMCFPKTADAGWGEIERAHAKPREVDF